ncbi:hypothetical protein SUGI_0646580 [Cryptomeria japonica]|nr:hypothetical protein SUGI_0646580 [Cryptomeria japonica]
MRCTDILDMQDVWGRKYQKKPDRAFMVGLVQSAVAINESKKDQTTEQQRKFTPNKSGSIESSMLWKLTLQKQ